MNVEDIREFCLSLGSDVEEKLPFVKFKNGEGVLVFYVCGHMFCFFDLNDFQTISLKCQPERIDEIIVPSRLRTESPIRLCRQPVQRVAETLDRFRPTYRAGRVTT